MRKPSTAHSSRRAPPLKDSDYDHEINLVDHAAETVTPQALSPEPGQQPEQPADQPSTSSLHPQPQPEPEPAPEQEQEPDPDSGEGPSSSQKVSAQDRSLRDSTSSASAASRHSNEASKKAASPEGLTGDAAVPDVEVTGEKLQRLATILARMEAQNF